MSGFRLICFENDCGCAANIGGPANVSHKTFLMEDMASILRAEKWLVELRDSKQHRFVTRGIVGVELIENESNAPESNTCRPCDRRPRLELGRNEMTKGG